MARPQARERRGFLVAQGGASSAASSSRAVLSSLRGWSNRVGCWIAYARPTLSPFAAPKMAKFWLFQRTRNHFFSTNSSMIELTSTASKSLQRQDATPASDCATRGRNLAEPRGCFQAYARNCLLKAIGMPAKWLRCLCHCPGQLARPVLSRQLGGHFMPTIPSLARASTGCGWGLLAERVL